MTRNDIWKLTKLRVVAALGLVGTPLVAQVAPSTAPGADVITTAEITRHLQVLGRDSMQGRDTPSPSLERTATYLTTELKRLVSSDGDTAETERYAMPGNICLDWSKTYLSLLVTIEHRGKPLASEEGGIVRKSASINFVTAARPASEFVDLSLQKRTAWTPVPVALVAGPHTPQSIQGADLRSNYVIYIPPARLDSLGERRIVDALLRSSRGVIVFADEDSLTFARRLATARQQPFRRVDYYMSGRMGPGSWGAYVWLPAVRDLFTGAAIDVTAMRESTRPVVMKLPVADFELSVGPDTTRGPAPTAPNVVAVLEGSDPKLKNESVAFTAHMDAGRDGRGDNAVGMAGLLALAKAFSSPAARPKRTLVFLATSGAVKDWWGARYFADPYEAASGISSRVVASLHLDAIDQITADSLAIDGLHDFAATNYLTWVKAVPPELGVTLADGGPVDRSLSNLGAYLVRSRPSLAFRAYHGGDVNGQTGSPVSREDTISRVLRLIFYIGDDLANASRIRWSPEGRRGLQQALDSE